MTVRVARGLLSRLRAHPSHIVVQVQACPDPEAAAAALEGAIDELFSLGAFLPLSAGPDQPPDTPEFVSDVLRTPTGPLLYMDGGVTPYAALRTIPDVVARHLTSAGITDAVIASPPTEGPLFGGWKGLIHVPRAVVLRLYPPQLPRTVVDGRYHLPTAAMPREWLAEAVAWVGTGLSDDAELLAALSVVEFRLTASNAAAFYDRAARSQASSAVVVAGELSGRLQGANGCFSSVQNLALAAGGPEASDDELVDALEALIAVGRRLAPAVGYGFVAVDPTFGGFTTNFPVSEGPPGGAYGHQINHLLDEVVPDGFPWQLLSGGHLARLGGSPSGARPLPEGKVELAVGDARDWLLKPPPRADAIAEAKGPWAAGLTERRRNPAAQEEARRVLSRCLIRKEEVDVFTMRARGTP